MFVNAGSATTARALARIKEYAPLTGQRITVKVSGGDYRPHEVITGLMVGLSEQLKGDGDWAGKQWNMVIKDDRGRLFSVALTRILTAALAR